MSTQPNYGLLGGAPSDASAATLALLNGYNRGHCKNPVVEGASNIWAVGSAETAAGVIDYPLSWTDIACDEAWANTMLDLAGVAKDDLAFFSYIYSRSAQTWPWLKAGFDRGAKLATGMSTQWDAYRLEMYCRLITVKLVFGVTPEVLDGLEGGGHKLATVFNKVDCLISVGAAWDRLRNVGFSPWKLHWLGPIIAIDPCDGGGARFDHAQWAIDRKDGCLLISNTKQREATFQRVALAARGEVDNKGGEPRLFLD